MVWVGGVSHLPPTKARELFKSESKPEGVPEIILPLVSRSGPKKNTIPFGVLRKLGC